MKQRDKEITLAILAGATREDVARAHAVTPARAGQIFTKIIFSVAPEIAKSMTAAANGKKNGPTCFISQALARTEQLSELTHNAEVS